MFRSYLGQNKTRWAEYDAVELSKRYNGPKRQILIDQGSNDIYYKINDLKPENLIKISNSKLEWDYRLRDNYDHDYFYVSTFIDEHLKFFFDKINK